MKFLRDNYILDKQINPVKQIIIMRQGQIYPSMGKHGLHVKSMDACFQFRKIPEKQLLKLVRIMKTLSRFFKEFDMFTAPATLRAREEPETKNGCAGILSILLICSFAYVFINSAVDTINFQKIQYKTSQSFVQPRQDFNTTEVMFGISIPTIKPYQQNIFFFSIYYKNIQYPLTQCTENHWSGLSSNSTYVSETYSDLNLTDYLCPPKELMLRNEPNSKNEYVSQTLIVELCDSGKSDKCYSIANVLSLIQASTQDQKFAQVRMIILDTGFTPSQKSATTKFTNTEFYFTFSFGTGAGGQINFGRYQIETDLSFFPVQEKQNEIGIFVDTPKVLMFDRTAIQPVIFMILTLNSNKLTIERVIGKLDELLSYAGGLFSIIIGFLAFFMNSFNEYRYELMIAEGAFAYDSKGKKIREKNFNFFRYIKYSIYDWINTLFCTQLNWESCRQIDSTRQEANKQIDVTHLFRRLNHLQNCLKQVLDENKKTCLYLMGSESILSAKKKRMISQYYDWIIKEDENVLTAPTVDIIKEMASNAGFKGFQQQFVSSINNSAVFDSTMIQMPELQQEANEIVLDAEQIEIEKQIAKQFYSLPSRFRERLEKKIPLKILYRLRNRKQAQQKDVATEQMINM